MEVERLSAGALRQVVVEADESVVWRELDLAEQFAALADNKRRIAPKLAVGFVPPNPQLVFSGVWSTVGDEIRRVATLHGQGIDHILTEFDLGELLGSRPHNLSGGEAIRAAIALVAASQPSVWVLDRCFEWLESKHRDVVAKFFRNELSKRAPIVEISTGRTWFVSESSSRAPADHDLHLDREYVGTTKSTVLELRGVEARLSPSFVLGPIALTITAGERVALLGPNGAGKSTLAKVIAGLVAHQGSATVAQRTPRTRREWAQCVVYSFQNPDDQIFRATVGQEITETARRAGRFDRKRSNQISKIIGLSGAQRDNPLNLPLSQRRLVTIAATLVPFAPLAILDEPSAFLSGSQVSAVHNAIDLFVELGGTVVAITHDREFATRFASRIIQMERGRITFDSVEAQSR